MINDIFIVRYDKIENRTFNEERELYQTSTNKEAVLSFIKQLEKNYEVQCVFSFNVKTKEVTEYKLKLDGFKLIIEPIVKPKRTRKTPSAISDPPKPPVTSKIRSSK